MKRIYTWSFAAFTELAAHFPFRLRSCGTAYMNSDSFLPKPRTLNSFEILWGISGIFQVVFPEGRFTVKAGDVCCYLPGETHIFHIAPGEKAEYCWVAFEGSASVEFWKTFKIPRTPHYAGPCPEELFARLYELIRCTDDHSVLAALSEGIRLLVLSTEQKPHPEKKSAEDHLNYAKLAQSLADLNFTDRRMNVNQIAESLGIHRVHLSRLFHQEYGLSLSRYLIGKRLACAEDLLLSTGLSVKNVAVKAGFADPVYFTRCFRSEKGISPQRFRENFAAGTDSEIKHQP